MLAESGFFSRPAEVLAGMPGYGQPLAQELEWLATEVPRRREHLQAAGAALLGEAEALVDPVLAAEMAAIRGNVDALGTRLRALHEAGGGLVLP